MKTVEVIILGFLYVVFRMAEILPTYGPWVAGGFDVLFLPIFLGALVLSIELEEWFTVCL